MLVVLLGSVAALGIVYVWLNEFEMTIRIGATIVGLIAAIVCYLFPAWQFLKRSEATSAVRTDTIRKMLLAAGLSGVPLLATWGGVMWVYKWVETLTTDPITKLSLNPDAKPITQIASSIGAAIGCYLAAMVCGRWGRRPVYALLCVASAITLFCFYSLNAEFNATFVVTAGLVGLITAAFYGWLPLYLPELFRTNMRATGQGFGFNFGRILAAVGALQTGALLNHFENNYAKACSVAAGVYVLGLVLIWFAPETKGKPLPE